MKIGFIINPIAGMGGRVGLKGTDGVLEEAKARGAIPIAGHRAIEAINRYVLLVRKLSPTDPFFKMDINWFTCSGSMGFDVLENTKVTELKNNFINVEFEPNDPNNTTADDTRECSSRFLQAGVELILFCGGDGTARDVYSIVQDKIPIFGIPSGVKMHSGVFATHANTAGDILLDYILGELDTADGEILDLDEERYRAGDWNIRLFGIAKTPYNPSLIQRGKHMVESASEEEIKEEIADYLKEEIENNQDTLFILGAGSTVQVVTQHLGLDGTLLGIDAVFQGRLVGKDLNEKQLIELLEKHDKVKIILSPIGAQGFILGRGNLQLSPTVIKRIGIENIDIVSTPAKLEELGQLRVDTNDDELDLMFTTKGWLKVIFSYRQMRLKKVGK